MTPEEDAFAAALAAAIADDIRAQPPPGELVRVVLRWFEADDPLYFVVHALGTDERDAVADEDAWYPLEWPNVDAEEPRAARVAEQEDVKRAGEALAAHYEAQQEDEDGEWAPSAAIVETVRRLPDALRAAGVPLATDFAASAAHLEGWGSLAVLEQVASPAVLEALRARGELPED